MESIINCLVKAGYYRARIDAISDFDKIIGGMAWAMQLFSYDINIEIFYTDSLDLGQKIALTERIVMVLLAVKCPYRIEPHQIVGLDYESLLPVIRWLMKRSEELRAEHEAFNRLLALRHYFRVTNTHIDRSNWSYLVRVDNQHQLTSKSSPTKTHPRPAVAPRPGRLGGLPDAQSILDKINETFKDNKQVSFVNLTSVIQASRGGAASRADSVHSEQSSGDDSSDFSAYDYTKADDTRLEPSTDDHLTCFTDDDAKTTVSEGGEDDDPAQNATSRASRTESLSEQGNQEGEERNPNESDATGDMSPEEVAIHQKLDLELLATNQKILNLLKKLDSMPSHLEISQYQARYVELHQQLIAKNKSIKKLFDLFNSLNATKHYLEKELNLLESISQNLDIVHDSHENRASFMHQFNEIVVKISSIRDDMSNKVASLRNKCSSLATEHEQLLRELELYM